MGYQALLFCPDEKLARIVTQVFGDLEFNMEPVQEPFSAVKKLMAQRYDALVVDCETESNASLLFKSARNSNSNQGTLAIALVEGQAGVAKAYRIGANLVLTKPINVEQAKGTLRVARGLLRKNSEAVTPSPVSNSVAPAEPARATPASSAPASPAVSVNTEPAAVVASKVAREVPEFEPVTPTIAASATVVEAQVTEVSAPEAPAKNIAALTHSPQAVDNQHEPPVVTTQTQVGGASASLTPASSGVAAAQGTAAAPAKVKEGAFPEAKVVEFAPVDPVLAGADSEPVGSTPSFSALDLDQSARAGGGKKILIAAVVLLAVAALGYFGWSKLHSGKSVTPVIQPVRASQASVPVPEPAPAASVAASAPAPASVTEAPSNHAPAMSEHSVSTTVPAKSAPPTVIRLDAAPETEVKTQNIAPLKVKSGASNNPKGSGEESSALAPSPLALAEANPGTLSNLVTSPSAAARQPSLATIKISQGVSQGLVIKRVSPKYPPMAITMRVQGTVLLDATIDREGKISDLKVVKGDQILARAAVDAVRQWRYKPYYLDGQPVEIETQITINFKLPN
jgi:protein TonB